MKVYDIRVFLWVPLKVVFPQQSKKFFINKIKSNKTTQQTWKDQSMTDISMRAKNKESKLLDIIIAIFSLMSVCASVPSIWRKYAILLYNASLATAIS